MLINNIQSSVNSLNDTLHQATATPEGNLQATAARIQTILNLSSDDIYHLRQLFVKEPMKASWFAGLQDENAIKFLMSELVVIKERLN